MAEYVCLDGPLQGHVSVMEREPKVGDLVTIDLVGIDRSTSGGSIAEAHYQAESAPLHPTPGFVRFVAVRGIYRKPALPASLRALTTA